MTDGNESSDILSDRNRNHSSSNGSNGMNNQVVNGEINVTFADENNGVLSKFGEEMQHEVDTESLGEDEAAQEIKSDSSSIGEEPHNNEENENPRKSARRPVTKSKSFVIRKSTSSPSRPLPHSHQPFNKKFNKKREAKHNSYEHFNKGKSNFNRTYSAKDQHFSKPFNVERFENNYSPAKKINPSTWSLYNSDIQEHIKEINGIPKYAITGFHVAQSTKVTSDTFFRYDYDKTSTYEKVFRQQVYLQIMLKFTKQIKFEDYNGKDAALKALYSDIIDADINLKESTLNILIQAAISSETLLNRFYGDKLLIQKKLPLNRFNLSGVSDLMSFGEDILGNRFKYLMLFKVSVEKFVLSRYICELFLHGLIMDISTLHLLYYHLNEGTLAVYEFKFKFDKLKEYNKTVKVKQICENLFKGVYGHYECKILFRDAKDIEVSKRR